MNKVYLKKGQEIFIENSDITYKVFNDTPLYINEKVYFSDGDNFFHYKKNTNLRFSDEIDIFINEIKNILNSEEMYIGCQVNNDSDKFWIELKKNTVIVMNDLPVNLGIDMKFYIEPETLFYIPENTNIELISRNNIIQVLTRENIDCYYSKIL